MKQIKIVLPETKDELKISTFIKLKEIEGMENLSHKERVSLTMQAVFGLDKEDVKRIKFKDVMDITEHFEQLMRQEEKRQIIPIIEYKGIQYGCIPNLDDVELNEYIDLEESQEDPLYSNVFMNVMYRRIIKSDKRSKYKIESYDESESVDFGDLPVSVLERAKVFFYTLGSQLLINTEMKLKTMTPMLQARKENTTSQKDGILLSTISLEEIPQNVTRLWAYQYTRFFYLTELAKTLAHLREEETKEQCNDRD